LTPALSRPLHTKTPRSADNPSQSSRFQSLEAPLTHL
jgi:hypothetical protein